MGTCTPDKLMGPTSVYASGSPGTEKSRRAQTEPQVPWTLAATALRRSQVTFYFCCQRVNIYSNHCLPCVGASGPAGALSVILGKAELAANLQRCRQRDGTEVKGLLSVLETLV